MMPVSFSVCLHLGASSSRTFSLLPSRRFNPLYAAPPPFSEGGEAAAAASHRITKVRAAVKPADGGLPSSVTVQRKSAAPRHLPQGEGKGGCRRRAQILPPQFRRRRSKSCFSKGKGFSPHKFAVFVAPGRVFCYNIFNNTQNAQKGLFV